MTTVHPDSTRARRRRVAHGLAGVALAAVMAGGLQAGCATASYGDASAPVAGGVAVSGRPEGWIGAMLVLLVCRLVKKS